MGPAGSSILILFSLSRVRMRLTVARLRPVDWAMRTPVQRSRRSRCTRSINSAEVVLGRSMRARAAIAQAGLLLGAEATYPLGRALPALDHGFGKFLSTINRKSSMMVIVHSVSSVAVASQHQLPSSWPNGQQPIETSHLALARSFFQGLKPRSLLARCGTSEDVP